MQSIHVLLVEDNEGDIVLTLEALEERKVVNNISVVKDGKEALDFLFETEKFRGRKLPDLILLDVNLPKKSGHEVLQTIKDDDNLKHIPVIMLTTSSSERDIKLSYQHHANCYITKPVEVDQFLEAITSIEDFWLSIVTLPNKK